MWHLVFGNLQFFRSTMIRTITWLTNGAWMTRWCKIVTSPKSTMSRIQEYEIHSMSCWQPQPFSILSFSHGISSICSYAYFIAIYEFIIHNAMIFFREVIQAIYSWEKFSRSGEDFLEFILLIVVGVYLVSTYALPRAFTTHFGAWSIFFVSIFIFWKFYLDRH